MAILGNDAVLAARPATAVQLAHACLRAGFETTIPASWGDELVAAESVRQLGVRGDGGAILCACPHVEAALLAPGDDLAPLLVPVVAPPVAAARYVRRVLGDTPLRITYVGRCPSASADPSIDVQLSPASFLRQLAERGIVLADQPTVFDSVLPPDRRRHFSLPGGTPAPSCLWEGERTRTLIEIESDEYKSELAQHLIAHRRAVIDLAPRLGCACSGAVGTATQASARASVMNGEPPRAAHPVVEAPEGLQLSRRIVPRAAVAAPAVATPAAVPAVTRAPRTETPRTETPRAETPHSAPREPARAASREAPRAAESSRKTPSGPFRAYTGHVPTTRSAEGRPLPRAYAAHRRTPGVNRAVGHDAPPAPSDSARAIEIVCETDTVVVERSETVETVTIAPVHPEPPRAEPPRVEPPHAEPPSSGTPSSEASEPVVERAAEPELRSSAPDDDRDVAADEPVVEMSADDTPSEAHEEEPPARRASATVITHTSSRQSTSSIVALVRTRSIDRYREPTAFRLPYPRDPRSLAIVGLTLAVAAVLAVSAIRASRAPDDREVSAATEASALGTARADAATLPPAAAGRADRAGRSTTSPDARSAAAPPVVVPSRPRGEERRAAAPAPAAPRTTTPAPESTPRSRRAAGRTSRRGAAALPPAVPADSVATPAPGTVAPRPAQAESAARTRDSVAGRASAAPAPAVTVPSAPPGITPAERDSIQREIAARRARADSIQRRIDSMRTP